MMFVLMPPLYPGMSQGGVGGTDQRGAIPTGFSRGCSGNSQYLSAGEDYGMGKVGYELEEVKPPKKERKQNKKLNHMDQKHKCCHGKH